MDNSSKECHEPACMLAHRLVDKLTAIVGYCELGNADAPSGTESAKRFEMIQDMANKMATELSQHQCHLSGLVQVVETQNRLLT